MQGTEQFTRVIADFLNERARVDNLFAQTLQKKNKNIDDCITYILNEVQKSGCNGFSDDEIFSMAIHYYDEDNLEIGKPLNGKVVVNHHIELTEEERKQARERAIAQYQAKELEKLHKQFSKPKKEKKEEDYSGQLLFDIKAL